MAQKMFNVRRWAQLEDGKVLTFPSPRKRKVVIDVNSTGESQLWYISEDGEALFLALVRGRDTLDFITDGKFSLSCLGDECWVYTVDGENIAYEDPSSISFTKIVERRARNPELMEIEARLMQNITRRLAAQSREQEAYFERRERLIAHQQQHAAALASANAAAEQESDEAAERSGDEDAASG